MDITIPKFDSKNMNHAIKIIGAGSGGSHAVSDMYKKGIKDVDFVICDTDRYELFKNIVPNKILLGGTAAGDNSGNGRQEDMESIDEIKDGMTRNVTKADCRTGEDNYLI
ncbi:MAG: hypothetical protein LBH60_09035 [Prevotellaceae bacterium]|jgi:cell division protein FtsZ|nr:hypothetical protein [Prevotellaceae bacterium]